MQHSFFRFLGVAAFTLASILPAQQQALLGGFVDGADFFIYMDSDQMNKAPVVKTMQEMQAGNPLADQQELVKKFEKATGLAEDDMDSLVFSMDFDAIDMNDPDKTDFDTLPAAMAVSLKKAITLDQLQAGIQMLAEEHGGADEVVMQKETRNGVALLSVKPKNPEDNGPTEILASLSPDGKTVLAGFNLASIQKGVERMQAGQPAQPSPGMAGALRAMNKKQMRIAFLLTQPMKDQIAAQAQGGGNPMGAMFATVQGITFSAHATQTLDLDIRLDMGNPNSANQLSMMAQQMMPMMMMQASQMAPGAQGILQKLKIAPDQNYISATLSLTEDDLKAMQEAADPMGAGGME